MDNKLKNCIKILSVVIPISIIVFLVLSSEEKPISSPLPVDKGIVANIKKPVDTSNWTNYLNSQLGFWIKIPPEVPTLYRCPDNTQSGNTPLGIYEDNQNGIVYISAEYYYDANWSYLDQKFIGSCDKITYSLESLENRENDNGLYIASSQKPFLGWKIVIRKAENEEDVLKYIKENFGSTCTIVSKNLQNDGNYQINIKGRDLTENGQRIMDETCLTNFVYKILYSPEKNKLMSVVLGQECTFSTNPSQCCDEEMFKSFRFE
ncbi:MAG: hypothetical protein WA091_00635 [Minisyncoccales bacterium]